MSEPVRDLLRKIHRWLGLALALPLLAQAATGLILVATPPFEAMRLPVPQPFEGPPHGIAAIIAAARYNESTALVPLRYQAGSTERDTATVDLAHPSERVADARIFVNPGTLEVLEWRERPDDFYRWVHGWHEVFLIGGPFGRGITGWAGLGLFTLGLIGIPIWWPRRGGWKAAFSIAVPARGYRFHRSLHGAAGGWFVALLMFQGLSGASMAFPGVFGAILGVSAARMPSAARVGVHDIDADAVAAAAHSVAPGTMVSSLRLPNQPGRPAIVTLRREAAPPVTVFVDLSNARVIAVRDPREASAGAKVLAWLRALHSGEGLGPLWRAIIVSAGMSLALFPITGLAMWVSRRRDRRRHPERQTVLQGVNE